MFEVQRAQNLAVPREGQGVEVQRGLRLFSANCIVVIRRAHSLRVELAQRKQRSTYFDELSETNVLNVELRKHAARMRML